MKKLTVSKMNFFFIAVILLWLKSYFLYLIEFNLDVSNGIQQFLLFFNLLSSALIFLGIAFFVKVSKSGIWIITIYSFMILFLFDKSLFFFNPLSSALIFLGIALFAKGRKAGIWIITIYSLMSLFLYAQAVFFRANSDYITLPTLTQTSNFGSLGGSIASLITWTDLFYALDIVVLIALYVVSRKGWSLSRMKLRKPLLVITAGVVAFAINLGLAEADRPQLLKRTFDRNYIV